MKNQQILIKTEKTPLEDLNPTVSDPYFVDGNYAQNPLLEEGFERELEIQEIQTVLDHENVKTVKVSKDLLRAIRRPKTIEKIQKNLNDCGSWITQQCPECGWYPEKEHDPHNIHVSCGIRICKKEHCTRIREIKVRRNLEKYFKVYKHLHLLVLTIDYTKYEFYYRKDIQILWKKVRKLIDKCNRGYGIQNVIASIDVIKKPEDKWHIHFNVIYDGKYVPVEFIRKYWNGRFTLHQKKTKRQKISTFNYVVKRIASINPAPRTGAALPITVEEYYEFFYKSHFYRAWYWRENPPILVSIGNKSISENRYCPECGTILIPKSLLNDKPPPDTSSELVELTEIGGFI